MKKYVPYLVTALVAVVLADRIRALPVVGSKIPTI